MSDNQHSNTTTYETVKTHLKNSLEYVIAAGHTVREFSEFTLDKFGDTYIPHLRRFLRDVSKGEIKIKGLSKTAIVDHRVSLEAREAMIREAAYYRAESRGFAAGHEADDWAAAEREVDTRLAEEEGLIAKGREVLESAVTSVEKEFENLKTVVTAWLEEKYGSVKKNAATKKVAAKKTTKEASTPSKTVANKENVAKAASQEEKKATKKSEKKKAAPKKAATKEPAKELTLKRKTTPKKATKKRQA
jgi:Protein of unknown function (DUF2934)